MSQRDVVRLYLSLCQAGSHALAAERHALLLHHLFHHGALLRRQILQLPQHQLHVRQLLSVHLHIARRQFPQAGLQHLRLSQGVARQNIQANMRLFISRFLMDDCRCKRGRNHPAGR